MSPDGVTAIPSEIYKKNSRSPPAITATRSCRFLNLSLFQSKGAAIASSPQQRYNRSASVDNNSRKTCLAFHSFREALFCEQPVSSCHDQAMAEAQAVEVPQQQQQQQGSCADHERKVSRWRRIMGRFGGKKNRVREDDSQSKEQKKKPRRVVESSPAWDNMRTSGTTCKWVECGDLSRVPRRDEQKEDLKSHLVKRVLEPMRFVTSDLHERKDFGDGDGGGGGERTQVLVTHLRCTRGQEQGVVTAEVRVLARDTPPTCAIGPLIAMLDSSLSSCAHSALLTLYTLASGNNVNKAAIVDAGIVPKLLNLLQKPHRSTHDAVVAIFLSLSALDRNKPLIGSAGAVPQLVHILNQGTEPIRWESLRALYNLSLSQPNIKFFVESGAAVTVVDILSTNVHVHAEKALAVLGNMVGLGIGRKCVTETVVETLIGVLDWGGIQFAKCQERAAYVLMVLAHHSYAHRQIMVHKRAIPALLEVSLLGSALAQKRVVRILERLREDREQGGLQPRPMSAPMGPPRRPRKLTGEAPSSRIPGCHGSKMVTSMVRQSLEQNLQRIVRRANLPLLEILKGDGQSTTRAFSLAGGSSSKSLPF